MTTLNPLPPVEEQPIASVAPARPTKRIGSSPAR